MATEARKLRVGVFVASAVIIGLGAAIWLGASRYLADETLTVTYFGESVQGLDPGAAVKYRGVPAGRVASIGIAPDGDLIEVVMSVDTAFAKRMLDDPNLRAQLQLSGITGLRYVEIERETGEALQSMPSLSFKPPYPLIPSTRSQFKAIQEALSDVYDRVMSIDIPGVVSDTRAMLQAADHILRDERVQSVLTNFSELTDAARRATVNVQNMTTGVQLAAAVGEVRDAAAAAKGLLVDLREGETGKELHQALRGVDDLARTMQSFVLGMQGTLDRLNRTTDNLEQLTEVLREEPSLLIFSSPPPPRAGAGATP